MCNKSDRTMMFIAGYDQAKRDHKVKLLIHNIYSRRDSNGNVYWLAQLTSTASGKTGLVHSVSDSNASMNARNAGLEWGEFTCTEAQLPIREFNRLQKQAIEGIWSDDQVADYIRTLLLEETE